jgi:murein L,D-transpeptidase YcbB/YkuD
MRVVTGKPNHPTPVFSDVMTTIVVNPYWRIPESIVRKEMLKKLIKDPYYYEKRGKYLYSGWGAKSKTIDPATVNWKKYLGNKKHIPYHFMQEPGNRNALGRIKFLFPNKYAVYIHDTPSKRLFFRQTRAFSHGCMRIQKPRELLKALSLYNKNVHVNSLMKKLGTTDNTHIGLSRKIPIDIVYLTYFVDDYGNFHYRNDIYVYDILQLKSYGNNLVAKKSKKSKKSKKTKKQKSKTTKKKSPKKKSNIVEIGY